MRNEQLQGCDKISGQTVDGGGSMHVLTIGPIELKPAFSDTPVDLQQMVSPTQRTGQQSNRFRSSTHKRSLCGGLAKLTQIVETHLSLGKGLQFFHDICIPRKIAKQAIANAAVRNAAQLFLDRLQRLSRIRHALQL